MKNFNDYAEKAISRYGLAGYNNLAREVGITKCSMSEFRNGKKTPSEETFLKIVELSGLPKEEALIDLNLWRSKNNPELNKIWQRLSKMVGCSALFLVATTLVVNDCFANEISTLSDTYFHTKYILCDKSVMT